MSRHTAVSVFVLDIKIIFNTFINAVFVKNSNRDQPLVNSIYDTFQAISLSPLQKVACFKLIFVKVNVDVSFN